jgi:hypothetical protein
LVHEFGAGSLCERTSDTNIISRATTSDMEGLEINTCSSAPWQGIGSDCTKK